MNQPCRYPGPASKSRTGHGAVRLDARARVLANRALAKIKYCGGGQQLETEVLPDGSVIRCLVIHNPLGPIVRWWIDRPGEEDRKPCIFDIRFKGVCFHASDCSLFLPEFPIPLTLGEAGGNNPMIRVSLPASNLWEYLSVPIPDGMECTATIPFRLELTDDAEGASVLGIVKERTAILSAENGIVKVTNALTRSGSEELPNSIIEFGQNELFNFNFAERIDPYYLFLRSGSEDNLAHNEAILRLKPEKRPLPFKAITSSGDRYIGLDGTVLDDRDYVAGARVWYWETPVTENRIVISWDEGTEKNVCVGGKSVWDVPYDLLAAAIRPSPQDEECFETVILVESPGSVLEIRTAPLELDTAYTSWGVLVKSLPYPLDDAGQRARRFQFSGNTSKLLGYIQGDITGAAGGTFSIALDYQTDWDYQSGAPIAFESISDTTENREYKFHSLFQAFWDGETLVKRTMHRHYKHINHGQASERPSCNLDWEFSHYETYIYSTSSQNTVKETLEFKLNGTLEKQIALQDYYISSASSELWYIVRDDADGIEACVHYPCSRYIVGCGDFEGEGHDTKTGLRHRGVLINEYHPRPDILSYCVIFERTFSGNELLYDDKVTLFVGDDFSLELTGIDNAYNTSGFVRAPYHPYFNHQELNGDIIGHLYAPSAHSWNSSMWGMATKVNNTALLDSTTFVSNLYPLNPIRCLVSHYDPLPEQEAYFTNDLVALHNHHRFGLGYRSLKQNPKLISAAQKHSDWMANEGTMSHTGEGGSSFQDRADAEGYNGVVGENVAAGQVTTKDVFRGWLDSPPHRLNIENEDFVDVGFGIAPVSEGDGYRESGYYWTVLFGIPDQQECYGQIEHTE